jgi:hypothetical protein
LLAAKQETGRKMKPAAQISNSPVALRRLCGETTHPIPVIEAKARPNDRPIEAFLKSW